MGPRHELSLCTCKTAWFAPEWHVYIGSSPHLCLFFMQNSDCMTRLTSLYGSQTSSVVVCTHNSVLSTTINRVYWFHPSPVVLCMQNNDFSTWITSLYGSQPSSVFFFACETAPLGLEIQVSVGPRPHLWFLHAKQRHVDQNNKSLWATDMTCRFVHAKQRDLHQNDMFIWVPALICFILFMQNSDFMTRLTSLYASQTSSVVLSTHNSVLSTRINRAYWFQPSSVVFACKTAHIGQEFHVSMGPRPHLWFWAPITACLTQE